MAVGHAEYGSASDMEQFPDVVVRTEDEAYRGIVTLFRFLIGPYAVAAKYACRSVVRWKVQRIGGTESSAEVKGLGAVRGGEESEIVAARRFV